MSSGKIASWNFAEGDEVGPGDAVADIETDKSTVAYEVQEDGYIAKILIDEGAEADVGAPMFIVVEDEDDIAAFKDYVAGDSATATEVSLVKFLIKFFMFEAQDIKFLLLSCFSFRQNFCCFF